MKRQIYPGKAQLKTGHSNAVAVALAAILMLTSGNAPKAADDFIENIEIRHFGSPRSRDVWNPPTFQPWAFHQSRDKLTDEITTAFYKMTYDCGEDIYTCSLDVRQEGVVFWVSAKHGSPLSGELIIRIDNNKLHRATRYASDAGDGIIFSPEDSSEILRELAEGKTAMLRFTVSRITHDFSMPIEADNFRRGLTYYQGKRTD